MTGYKDFKSRLNALCERGKLDKTLKNRFCGLDRGDRNATAYSVCSELYDLFGSVERNSTGYSSLCDAVTELVAGLYADTPQLNREVATVCAYILLTKEANASADPAPIFKKLTAHAEDYEKSLQSLKYGFPLF